MPHNVLRIPCSPETIYYTFQNIKEVWFSNDFLKFIYQISIELGIKNTLLHKYFQTDMILFDQFKMSTIKLENALRSFMMIPIALLKKFGS